MIYRLRTRTHVRTHAGTYAGTLVATDERVLKRYTSSRAKAEGHGRCELLRIHLRSLSTLLTISSLSQRIHTVDCVSSP